ncbi:ABC transporter permease [Bacillus marasmi]|uniref:ABC transporter permease n=1 Tax=Bacillus marasmi TaxID=1926279 RepID=UPI00164DFCA1|nr:ABC transporter permease [Bacillus marasmi]
MDTYVFFRQEWKSSLRQKSFYLFAGLFLLIMAFIFMIQLNIDGLNSFTNVTATAFNVLLYSLPLIVMLLGAFSITEEREAGRFALLLTYPFKMTSFIMGKFLGQFVTHLIVITFSFGVFTAMSFIFNGSTSVNGILLIFLFAILVTAAFLAIGILIGVLSSTRWQSMMIAIALWFIFIMIWPMLLIGSLSFLKYNLVKPILLGLTVLNPAELLRVFFVIQFEGGSIFGQQYYQIIDFLKGTQSFLYLLIYVLLYVFGMLAISTFLIGRKVRK